MKPKRRTLLGETRKLDGHNLMGITFPTIPNKYNRPKKRR